MLDTTYSPNDPATRFNRSVGRSRTGDQLHISYAGSYNALCNQRMKLSPIKGTLRVRPGLFCVKCFGNEPTNWNRDLAATEIVR